jgi:hypothetical protein
MSRRWNYGLLHFRYIVCSELPEKLPLFRLNYNFLFSSPFAASNQIELDCDWGDIELMIVTYIEFDSFHF